MYLVQGRRFAAVMCAILSPAAWGFVPTQMAKLTPSLKMSTSSTSTSTAEVVLQVGEEVGHGSYGTVHLCTLQGNDIDTVLICKRAWDERDLVGVEDPEYRAARCKYYFDVEQHCFEKMEDMSGRLIPDYLGTFQDTQGQDWMTFSIIHKSGRIHEPAMTLGDALKRDMERQTYLSSHHLYHTQEALGLGMDATLADTLDTVLLSMLEGLDFIHSHKIVHRDIKPDNLLCNAATKSLVLIDFGSAADLAPVRGKSRWILGGRQRVGLEDGSSVAVSPIYAAPEVFVSQDRSAYQFDVFSSALVFAQLLFNFLDERTDAGFHQQLEDANWDLDTWLSRELSATVRPAGLEEALEYLGSRRGLWGLLGEMFRRDPDERITSSKALRVFRKIMKGNSRATDDGPFFESVLDLVNGCGVEPTYFMSPRPLHFVGNFLREWPLGLHLAEAGEKVEGLEGEALEKWERATATAEPHEVFVKEVIEGSQADIMDVFEVGDQLQGVGDLPIVEGGGFEAVVDMVRERVDKVDHSALVHALALDQLEKQPKASTHVKLHFARQSERPAMERPKRRAAKKARVEDQGAFTLKGRRQAQEDAFVLHDIQGPGNVLIAGVFDGHAGTAASTSASELMPDLLTKFLANGERTTRQALEKAWETACEAYRWGCDEHGTCMAEYDEVEGILLAGTGASDVVAGTTASMATVQDSEITVLNCGDSRTLLVNNNGNVQFATEDHTPEAEMDRLLKGVDDGWDFAIPECSVNKYYMQVGDMSYAVARSLEGSYATYKGIISTPDVTSLRARPGVLVMASDGLFEVMDNAQVGRQVARMKRRGLSASEAAKLICCMAFDEGTTDNVSVVVVYLE